MKILKIHIQKATSDKAYDIGYVHSKSWQIAYAGIIPQDFLDNFTPEKRAEIFKKVMPTRPEEYYIAYVEGQPIGMLIIGTTPDADVKPNTGDIMALYLLPEFWGKGYGKELMDFGVNRLYELSHNDIVLWVLESNKRAIKFYEKYGFTFDGVKREINIGKPLTELRFVLHYTK